MESKMTLKTIGSLFVMLLLVQMSTQQFSYSANWGKRKADYSYETECLTALRLKTLVENQIANYYDKSVFKFLQIQVAPICRKISSPEQTDNSSSNEDRR